MATVTENATVSVPEEYADDFRAALEREIRFEVEEVEKWRIELEDTQFLPHRGRDRYIDVLKEDLRGAEKLLAKDVRLLDQIGQQQGAIELCSDDFETIAHVFESMVQRVVGPRLQEALEVGPLDEDYAAATLRGLISRLSWAVEESARLHGLAVSR